MPQAFTYHRAISPMMWVLVGLSSIELIVVHGLLAFWRPWIAVALSVVTLAGIVWLIVTIRSFPRLPVLVGADWLDMRVGRLTAIQVSAANVSGLRLHWTADSIKSRDVLNLALIAYPNVVVDLLQPQRVGYRMVGAVAHRLDDPVGFAAALDALGRAHD